MKQFAAWFTHGASNGSQLRKVVYESKTETRFSMPSTASSKRCLRLML